MRQWIIHINIIYIECMLRQLQLTELQHLGSVDHRMHQNVLIQPETSDVIPTENLVLRKDIIITDHLDFLTLNVIEHSMHINIMTKQEELARNIVTKTNDIRVICTTVHKSKGLEYGCVIMPYMGMDIASMKKS